MIAEIILLLIVLWIVMSLVNSARKSSSVTEDNDRRNSPEVDRKSQDPRSRGVIPNSPEVDRKLAYIASVLDAVCEDSNVTPEYYLVASDTLTFVENKRTIHLVITHTGDDTRFFDDNTLVAAGIHELTHILCPGDDHSPLFDKMEEHFLTVAERLSYYNPKIDIDADYPCLDVPF